MVVLPNPNSGNFVVKFNLQQRGDVKISLYTIDGRRLEEKTLSNLPLGENIFERKLKPQEQSGTYLLTLETPYEKATRKIIIER